MKILLVDDHQIIRAVLRKHITDAFEVELIEASDGIEAIDLLKNQSFDLIITDMHMPSISGLELMEHINYTYPAQKVLALTMVEDFDQISQMVNAGVSGYVLKEGNSPQLLEAIERVMAGDQFFSPSVQEIITRSIIEKKQRERRVKLSKQELEIMRMVFEEMTDEQVAEKLRISSGSLQAYKESIMAKTGTENLSELVKYAIRERVFEDLFN